MLCRWVGGWGARIDSSREPERAASSYLCDLTHLFYFLFLFFLSSYNILDAVVNKVCFMILPTLLLQFLPCSIPKFFYFLYLFLIIFIFIVFNYV